MTTSEMQEWMILPRQFADLAGFVPKWCLSSQDERYPVMMKSSMADLDEFSRAMMSRLDDILGHLDSAGLDALAPQDQRLLDLATTFAEISHPVDLKWTEPSAADIFPFERIELAGPCMTW